MPIPAYSDDNVDFDDDIHVEYDVDRPPSTGGDIIVRNGYFVHFISPEHRDPLPKNIIFVIDNSGSMSGDRIKKVREAFENIISDLNDDDKFNIIYFADYAYKLWPDSKSPYSGSGEARNFVKSLSGAGFTDINRALLTAIQEPPDDEHRADIIFMTPFLIRLELLYQIAAHNDYLSL